MRFDELWTDDEPLNKQPKADAPLCPDGDYAGEIVKAEFRDLKFKIKPDNPRGTSLVIDVEVPGYRTVESIIPAQMRWLVEQVCRSASVNIPVRGEDWDAEQLVGRQVRIETVYGITQAGKEYVRVEKWIAGPAPLPVTVQATPPATPAAIKATPKRTPAAKVEAAGQGGEPDDIPF